MPTLHLPYDYKSCVEGSEKASWTLDAVFPEGTRLDFARPFLPETLAPTKSLTFLSDKERKALNQIAGNAYLNLFGFVEEYIIATVVQHTHAELFGDHIAIRAMCRFTDEEVKHQQLFKRYRNAFDRDFGVPCGVLEEAVAVAGVILSKTPIAVMLVTLHIELMTQLHYTEAVRDDAGLDPLFAKLLKQHWLEESQHARIDALELKKLVEAATPEAVAAGFKDYADLLDAFSGLLMKQSELDVPSLENKLGRKFDDAQRKAIIANQHKGYVKTFLLVGMTHPQFVDIIQRIDARSAGDIASKAKVMMAA